MNKIELQHHIVNLRQSIIPFSIVLVAVSTVITSMQYKTGWSVANTTVWWIVQAMVLYVFITSKKYFIHPSQAHAMKFVRWYLFWNIFSIFHGILIAENYWDWKSLIAHTLCLLIPIVAYSATNKALMQSILRIYIKYAIPLFGVLAFLILPDAYGYYLVPIAFLSLFFPVLTFRWKLILLILVILVISIELNARSNVIKFSVPILFSLIYYFRLIISTKHIESGRKFLFIVPIMLFYLAVTDVFNVFNMDDYITSDYTTLETTVDGDVQEVSLTSDTRTALYVEVLETAEKYNSWLIGRSPARGYESILFGAFDETGRGERAGNEVAILNIFTWTGIVGVVLFLFVFYKASYLAVNCSNNIFAQILGLFVAFRWLYAWVEDINYFTLTTVFLWLTIGLCYSKSFRDMSNKEVEYWVQGIFDRSVSIK